MNLSVKAPPWFNRPTVAFCNLPSFREAAVIAQSEWPTANESRRGELASALQLIAAHNPQPRPQMPARPKRSIAELRREWHNSPAAARRIFNDSIAEFIRAQTGAAIETAPIHAS